MSTLQQIREVIVVEGTHDRDRILEAVQADVIVTGGSRIAKHVFDRMARVAVSRGIIVLTDPDYTGEQIRKRIISRFPNCKHAYLPRQEAVRGHDIGVENASAFAIKKALQNVRTLWEREEPLFSLDDMINAGLTANANASVRRAKVGAILGIGYGNTKAFLQRLNSLQVTKEEFARAVAAVCKEGEA